MLKHLLDPDNTKSAHKQTLRKLVHQYNGSEEDFIAEASNTYIPAMPVIEHGPYSGGPNELLDEEFTVAEIRAALQKLNTKSAPGPDGITNRTLRNLDDQAIENITQYINECWTEGTIPKTVEKS